jgi:hypothetical protein
MPHRHLVDDPEFWRSRAEEVRVIADDMKEAEAKAIMECIANDCADTISMRTKSEGLSSRRR